MEKCIQYDDEIEDEDIIAFETNFDEQYKQMFDQRIKDEIEETEEIKSEKITHDECDQYYITKYRVVTIVPSASNPKRNIRILTQDEIDTILHNYSQYAEFIVEVSKVTTD